MKLIARPWMLGVGAALVVGGVGATFGSDRISILFDIGRLSTREEAALTFLVSVITTMVGTALIGFALLKPSSTGGPVKLPKAIVRLVIASASAGAGFAVVFWIILGLWSWNQSRPKPPPPWNEEAITATFTDIVYSGPVEKGAEFVTIYYALENTTRRDYRLADDKSFTLMERLKIGDALVPQDDWPDDWPELLDISSQISSPLPLFLPQGERVRIYVSKSLILDSDANSALRAVFEQYFPNQEMSFEAYKDKMKQILSEASGFGQIESFVIFDHEHRYKINLPLFDGAEMKRPDGSS